MLLRMWGLLRTDPLDFFRILIFTAIALAIAITVHEFSHGLIASLLGDNTAKAKGRLSLNPLAHLDPIGTIMLFVIGFGWGKPVPVNPYYLRYGARSGMALVSLGGPISNLLFAAIFGITVRIMPDPFALLFYYIMFFNIILGMFNLIPLPPLDGFNILLGILPHNVAASFARIERYGPAILILIVLLDSFTGIGILWNAIRLPVNFFSHLFIGESLL